MKLNERGKELYNIWEKKYFEENDRRGGDSQNGDFVDGWCIIDSHDFVKNPLDVIGLYLFGYQENIFDIVADWKNYSGLTGTDPVYIGIDLTIDQFEKELSLYFE